MAGKKIETLVSDAVMEMIYDHTMMAQVIMSCGGVNIVDDKIIPAIAWTDGKSIYINKHYIKEVYEPMEGKLSKDSILFLIAHETLHLMLLSTERLGNKNRVLWNMATDYAINSILVYNDRFKSMPKGGLLDLRYKDWSAEQIYEDLMKQNKSSMISCSSKCNFGGSGSPDQNNQSSSKPDNDQIPLNSAQYTGDGSKENVSGDCDAQNQLTGNKITMDAHVPIDSDTAESVKLRVDDVMRSFSNDSSESYKRILKLRPMPKFPWRKVLEKHMKGFIKSNASWKIPSKRGLAIDKYLPSIIVTPYINIAITIDTSGSISQRELNLMFSHLRKILYSFKQFNVELFCFSTQVHKDTVIKLNKQNIRKFDIEKYELKSNGGTNIASAFKYIEDHKEKFDVFICMTDGYDSIDNLKFNKCPAIWAIVGNNLRSFKSPVGVKKATVIFMED